MPREVPREDDGSAPAAVAVVPRLEVMLIPLPAEPSSRQASVAADPDTLRDLMPLRPPWWNRMRRDRTTPLRTPSSRRVHRRASSPY